MMKLPNFSTRTWIAIALYPMVMVVMGGMVAVAALSITRSEEFVTGFMIPGIVVMFLLGIPVSWFLAPRLRLRRNRRKIQRRKAARSSSGQMPSDVRR
jgi:Na+(H+)/acetate symporter ActP